MEIPTDFCHFFCAPGNPCATPTVTRGEGSFSYQGVSIRGVRHSPAGARQKMVAEHSCFIYFSCFPSLPSSPCFSSCPVFLDIQAKNCAHMVTHQAKILGKEKAHKHKTNFFRWTARVGGGSPDRVARGLPTGGQGSKVYVLCAEPKKRKHFRPGTRPEDRVPGREDR